MPPWPVRSRSPARAARRDRGVEHVRRVARAAPVVHARDRAGGRSRRRGLARPEPDRLRRRGERRERRDRLLGRARRCPRDLRSDAEHPRDHGRRDAARGRSALGTLRAARLYRHADLDRGEGRRRHAGRSDRRLDDHGTGADRVVRPDRSERASDPGGDPAGRRPRPHRGGRGARPDAVDRTRRGDGPRGRRRSPAGRLSIFPSAQGDLTIDPGFAAFAGVVGWSSYDQSTCAGVDAVVATLPEPGTVLGPVAAVAALAGRRRISS
jgi:hypothetical protein